MILSCGDTLIDMLPRTLATGEDVYLPMSGGALFNTAIALGRLGQDVGLVTGVSTDMFGEQLIDTLRDSHVSTDYCIRTHRPTTMAFVKLVNGDAQYHFVDENSAQRMLTLQDFPLVNDAISTLHFGCLSLIAEPCATAFEQYMQDNASTKVISLDPNIRPGFIVNETGYRQRLSRMIAQSDIVKFSDEDFAWFNLEQSFDDFAKNLIEQGASLVMLTQSSNGVTLFSQYGKAHIPAQTVDVVDTVGAGDNFNAGVLTGLSQQGLLCKTALKTASETSLKQAVSLGITVASYTVQQAGATSPWARDIF